ncbi:MAG: TrkH family potassium uptake protein [Acidimicrobiaceae bacterium]|nr:TrkH family potassium uptake protein [Acidimicrobiaceae bacterium]
MPKQDARSTSGSGLSTDRHRYISTTLHIVGTSVVAVSLGMLACGVLEVFTTNTDTVALLLSGMGALILGDLLRRYTSLSEIRSRRVFAAVAWTWITTILIGSFPFILAGTFAAPGVDFLEQVVNSVFESASGFSCTGSTALADFTPGKGLGKGLLMYRQATQWYGGMGVVILAVAVLPFLGVGGLELIAAEAPGPSSDRLTPRVRETARRLWGIYIGLTIIAVLALFIIAGLSFYDSVAHALTVVSTGGFSPYASSIGHFDSVGVEVVLIVLMILGGANFSLHWWSLKGRTLLHWRDSEFRTYLGMLLLAATAVVGLLRFSGGFTWDSALRVGVFNVVSLGTSTGFSNATHPGSVGDYVTWLAGGQLVLVFLMLVGGCTGSTAGGIKIMRMQILGVVTVRSLHLIQRPRSIILVRLGRSVIPENVVFRVIGFCFMHIILLVLGLLLVTALGGNFETTLGAVVSALGNMGPALGEAGPTNSFSSVFSQPARLVLASLMIIGRLEIMSVLLMVALLMPKPGFWVRSRKRILRI